jgi:Ion channel
MFGLKKTEKKQEFEVKLAYLMWAFLMLFLAQPFLAHFQSAGSTIMTLLTTLVLLLGIFLISKKKKKFKIGIVLAFFSMSSKVIEYLHPNVYTVLLNVVCAMLFYGFLIGSLLQYILKAKKINIDVILGGISIYLLFGIFWVWAYNLVNYLDTNAFSQTVNWAELIYFSFITLTGVGYGDIAPVSAFARSIAVMEAVCGVLYLAIMISRLVGMYGKAED